MAYSLQDLVNKYNSYSNKTMDLLFVYLFVSRFGIDPAELDTLIYQLEIDEENIGILIPSPIAFDQSITSESVTMFTDRYWESVNDATTTSESVTVIAHLAGNVFDATTTTENISIRSSFIPTVKDSTTTSESVSVVQA